MNTDSKQNRREQSHQRILDAAARAVRRQGYAGVGVAEVMKEAGSAIAFGAFIAWARTASAPLVDLALFANRSYSAVNLATLAFGTTSYLTQWLPGLFLSGIGVGMHVALALTTAALCLAVKTRPASATARG